MVTITALKSLVLRCLITVLALTAIAFGFAPKSEAATGPLGYFK